MPLRRHLFFLIEIVPKGHHNLPEGQISHCASNISHFHQEIYHFPDRENITGYCENPFSQYPFGAFFVLYCALTHPLTEDVIPSESGDLRNDLA